MALEERSNTRFSQLKIQEFPCGRRISTKSLLNISTEAVVKHIDQLIVGVAPLPRVLKARILHLMSKRNNLLNDKTLPMVCSNVVGELDFTNTALISDTGLLTLPRLHHLRKIDLNDTRTGTRESISSKAVIHIAKNCPHLQLAYFRRCVNLCDKGIEALAEGCKYLLEINLSGCPLITDVSIAALSKNASYLRSLNLAYTSITDESAYSLAQGVCAKKLEEVQVSHCRFITDEGVEALLYSGSNITYLEIQACPLLTDRSLQALEELRERFDLKQFNFTIPF